MCRIDTGQAGNPDRRRYQCKQSRFHSLTLNTYKQSSDECSRPVTCEK
jgi:hypothetical protein